MNFVSGKEAGTTFERLFERQCQLHGLWAEPNHIRARRGWKGKLQELKSNLDYIVMGRGGKIAFIDCKSFDSPYFTFSDIPDHQLAFARRYNEYGIAAGFTVWFRPINHVIFFPGWLIAGRGPGTRFTPLDGTALGTWSNFDPTKFLNSASGSTMVG